MRSPVFALLDAACDAVDLLGEGGTPPTPEQRARDEAYLAQAEIPRPTLRTVAEWEEERRREELNDDFDFPYFPPLGSFH